MTSSLSSRFVRIDEEQGEVLLFGYDLHNLVSRLEYEAVLHLCLAGELPTDEQVRQVRGGLREAEDCSETDRELLNVLDQRSLAPLSWLEAVLAATDSGEEGGAPGKEFRRQAVSLIGRAACRFADRVRRRGNHRSPHDSSPDHGFARLFLNRSGCADPTPLKENVINRALILLLPCGLSPATLSARVAAGAGSGPQGVVSSGLGAFRGTQGSRSPSRVMTMFMELEASGEDPEAFLHRKRREGEPLRGFEKGLFRGEDPRTTHFRMMNEELGQTLGSMKWFDYARALEDEMLTEHEQHAGVYFHCAPVLYQVGLPVDCLPIFVSVARMAGWLAHAAEQAGDEAALSPRLEYTGPGRRRVPPE